MGRSSSCFKLITCGSDSAYKDDLDVPENNGSTDKRGWSFRKRSARHRVLSNTVISETTSSANKESPESANINYQSLDTSTIPEKASVIQCTNKKIQLPISAESKTEAIAVTKTEAEVDALLEGSVVIIIQTAVRGFLARKELLKLKNVVKLQAAVRGHLVRRHAIGTLRCIQAIVKVQALVRARRARLLSDGSYAENKLDGKHNKTTMKEKPVTKPNVTYTSIDKLLSNKFARQLMESTPKNRPIHIKCDSQKPNSAWNWLERWMSVSSADPTPKSELITEKIEKEKIENFSSPMETRAQSEALFEPEESMANTNEPFLPPESEENLITYDADNFKFEANHLTSSSVADNMEQPQAEKLNALPSKTEIEDEQPDQPKRSMKRVASEELETEGKKFVYGSRKASNPAFIAAQSRFEELSSSVKSNKSFSSLQQGSEVESNFNTVSSGLDTVTRTDELNLTENSVTLNLGVQYGGSECGTELSITSTLDSPDISEVGPAEIEHETKISEEDVEAKDAPTNPELIQSVTDQTEKLEVVKDESGISNVATDPPQIELKPERDASDAHKELNFETGSPPYRSSPEASPRSHITVPESQGTPSSQISVKSKTNRTEKSSTNKKRKSLSAGKRSPLNADHDYGARTSVEKLPKHQDDGKKHNSFGSTRPEHADQEPRDSGSSSSLPHFMQATESARAKISATSSPRSSPDVQDRDYIKKRHSLPGANGRQGSPRIQRATSQSQQGTKGNGSHAVREKRWQR